jgi:rhodanese-related sulfurtransferase
MDGEITVEQLQTLLEDGGDEDLRVVDIRSPGAFDRGHIPDSENIPAPELTDRVEELDGADRVVTVCPHGKASVQAARLVGSYEGVDGPVESLDGGLEAWDGPITDGGDAAAPDDTETANESTDDDTTAPF